MGVESQELNEESEAGDDQLMTSQAALRMLIATEPDVILNALAAALRLAVEAIQRPKDRYYTVIVPDSGEPAVLSTVDSFDEFLTVWRSAYDQRAGQIFGFYRGDVILPSRGGDCMVAPWATFPLFTKASDTETDPKGYLGGAPPIPKTPPKAPEPVDDEEDEEEDAVEEVDDHDGVFIDDDDEA